MKETFEKLEKHLYRRQYQTAGGVKTTLYYARFKDWKGKHRTIPLGSVLRTAREQLTVLEAQNIRHEDFDVDRLPIIEQERLTVSKYIRRFLETKHGLASYESYKVYCSHIGRILGSLPLDEITRTKIAEYNRSAVQSRFRGRVSRLKGLSLKIRRSTGTSRL